MSLLWRGSTRDKINSDKVTGDDLTDTHTQTPAVHNGMQSLTLAKTALISLYLMEELEM